MRKIDKLKMIARQACTYRGHVLPKGWKNLTPRPTRKAHTECLACGMYVQVTRFPAPNEIEVGGSAVAMDCTGRNLTINNQPEWQE